MEVEFVGDEIIQIVEEEDQSSNQDGTITVQEEVTIPKGTTTDGLVA